MPNFPSDIQYASVCKLPEALKLWVEYVRPDSVNIEWWDQMDVNGTYFKVKTDKHLWLVLARDGEIQCWRQN